MKTSLCGFCLALSSFFLSPSSFGQGSLTPPGAPAPTMKTLDQIEPRTPISTLPFTISAPGVYYLTKNITTTGGGITIDTDDAVLDLGGFTLTGDGTAGDRGVDVSAQARVTIRNGTLRNFGLGINLAAGTAEALVEDLTIVDCTSTGLFAPATASVQLLRSVFRRVRLVGNNSGGISITSFAGAPAARNVIDLCEALGNTNDGISVNATGNLIVRCLASGNGTNYNIVANNRTGLVVLPAVNAAAINGASGGVGSGTTDPFANLSY